MTRSRKFAADAVVALCISALAASGCDQEPSRPSGPNIVLLTFCTLRADRIGCYGHGPARTPTFDALAAEGVTFENNYTQASFSGGSFASILTGQYCFGHTVFDHPRELPENVSTIAAMLRAAGYRTAAFTNHNFLAPAFRCDRGFETYDSKRIPTHPAGRRYDVHVVGLLRQQADAAAAWIRTRSDTPFFLWVQAGPTHFPYRVPPRLRPPTSQPFDPAIVRHRDEHGHSAQSCGRMMFDFDSFGYTEEQLSCALALYDASVSLCDTMTAAVVRQLRDSGLLERTVIIVASDHGDAHGEHDLYFNHDANLYEATVRVPLLLRLPGGAHAGRRIDAVTRNIDLLPTVAELTGVDPPREIDGLSLVPLLDADAAPRDAFAETRPFIPSRAGLKHYRQSIPGVAGKWRMIRRGRYKLICIPGAELEGGDAYELYDVQTDPGETHDLSADLPQVRAELAAALAEWFAGYDAIDTTPRALSPQDVEDLRALGYIE